MPHQFPEARGIRCSRRGQLALDRPNPPEAGRPHLARPGAPSVVNPKGAGRIPAMALRQCPGLEVTAGENRFERLVVGVERNELASLVGGATRKVIRKWFWIRTLIIGAHLPAKSKRGVAS